MNQKNSANLKPLTNEAPKRTAAMEAIDQMIMEKSRAELSKIGQTAIEFYAANPGVGGIEMAKRLGGGACAAGLTMAIYSEAQKQGTVRAAAKDLLVREIAEEFPDGWFSGDRIGPAVKLSGWSFKLKKCVRDSVIHGYASRILCDLSTDHPPPAGWKPRPENDPLLTALFDRFWPAAPPEDASAADAAAEIQVSSPTPRKEYNKDQT